MQSLPDPLCVPARVCVLTVGERRSSQVLGLVEGPGPLASHSSPLLGLTRDTAILPWPVGSPYLSLACLLSEAPHRTEGQRPLGPAGPKGQLPMRVGALEFSPGALPGPWARLTISLRILTQSEDLPRPKSE